MLMQIPGWWQRHHEQRCYLFMSLGGGGVQSYLYANRVGFFVGKVKLLLVPALPYLLLRAPVEERYRAHSLLDITYLQLGPIHTCLLAHQLSDALPLLFFAQVSRDRLLFVSYRSSYATTSGAVRSRAGLRLCWAGRDHDLTFSGRGHIHNLVLLIFQLFTIPFVCVV